MNLLDRAVKLAAEQDEPHDMNFVHKHTVGRRRARPFRHEAATRIFSNSSGRTPPT